MTEIILDKVLFFFSFFPLSSVVSKRVEHLFLQVWTRFIGFVLWKEWVVNAGGYLLFLFY